jgi:AcrR family transcriptional regulator
MVFIQMRKRPYTQRKRAEQAAETKRRITEATVELHKTVGPAATRIAEVARSAGVQRLTVYNHFPDDEALLSACSAHWRSLHPAPDPAGWRSIADGGARLRHGLRALYGWYRETEPMTGNVLRDAESVPALRRIVEAGLGRYLQEAADVLAEPFLSRRRRRRIELVVRLAVDFHTWRALSALGDAEAAELAACLVEAASTEG